VVTFVGQFGDSQTKIEPWISALPAICAKVRLMILCLVNLVIFQKSSLVLFYLLDILAMTKLIIIF